MLYLQGTNVKGGDVDTSDETEDIIVHIEEDITGRSSSDGSHRKSPMGTVPLSNLISHVSHTTCEAHPVNDKRTSSQEKKTAITADADESPSQLRQQDKVVFFYFV